MDTGRSSDGGTAANAMLRTFYADWRDGDRASQWKDIPMENNRVNVGDLAAGIRSLAVRVSEAARLLDIGRSKAYELIRTGELPAIRVGKTVRVPVEALEAWVRRHIAESEVA